VFSHVNLGHFLLVLLAFVVLCLVSSVLGQEIGWEGRLRNYLCCVEWDIKPELNQSTIKTPVPFILNGSLLGEVEEENERGTCQTLKLPGNDC